MKGTTEDEMVGWRHQLSGHESEQTLGDGEGQGSLTCCSPWGCKASDVAERLHNTNEKRILAEGSCGADRTEGHEGQFHRFLQWKKPAETYFLGF